MEKILRGAVDDIDARLGGHREKMAQLPAVAPQMKPIPARDGRPRDDWLRALRSDMAGTKETAGMCAYLNAAIPRGDVLALLGEVLEDLLATVDGYTD